jgi:hypothetical protein
VSTQLEAVRLNGKCTIQLIETLVDMVSNLTKEVTHLKNDSFLLEQEKFLHDLIKASPRLSSQYIPRKRGSIPQRRGLYQTCAYSCPSTQTLPAASVPAGTTLIELYRDVV